MRRITFTRFLFPRLTTPAWAAATLYLLLAGPPASGQVAHLKAPRPGTIEVGTPEFAVLGLDALGLNSLPTDLHILPDGRLLVVADQELAIGDGVRWQVLRASPADQSVPVVSVAVDPSGGIYAGAVNGFARVELLGNGTWQRAFVAPWPKTEPPDRRIAREVIQDGGGWYWHSISGSVIQWQPGMEARTVINLGTVETIFSFAGGTYLCDRSDGSLWRIEPGRDTPVLVTEATNSDAAITCTVPFDETSLLVGTHNHGLHLFDGRAMAPFEASTLLGAGRRINDLCVAADGIFAAAVDGLGLVFFSRQGRVVQTLSRAVDPRLARPVRVIPGPDGSIWVLLNDGLARVEFPSRFSNYEALVTTGLTTAFPVRHEGRLWLAADGKCHRGVYDDDQRLERFEVDTPPGRFVFSLVTVTGAPLASTDDGIYQHEGDGTWRLVCPDLVNARILATEPRDGRWLYAARHELGWLRVGDGRIEAERMPVPELGDVYGWIVDKRGDVWIELGIGAVGRIRLGAAGHLELEQFGRDDGLADGWAQAFILDGEARFNVADKIYRFDAATGTIVLDADFARRFPQVKSVTGRPGRDAEGRFWITTATGVKVFDDRDTGEPVDLGEPMPKGFLPYYYTFEEGGVVWMHRSRRLLRFDPTAPPPPPAPLRALITRVSLIGSEHSVYPENGHVEPFAYRDNSLAFHVVAPGARLGQPVSFEFRLEGARNDWISTGAVGTALFNQLPEGRYVLHVRPRAGGEVGREDAVAFTVRAPWYRTPLAYALYGVLVAGVIGLIIWVPSYLQRREKARLAHLVAVRTRELHEANVELGRQIEETRAKADALHVSQERYRRLSQELEQRVEARTGELHRAHNRLLETNRELEAFSYSVSHDLRAPLRNISGFTELLRKRNPERLDPESIRYLDVVAGESVRLGQLIDSLLLFSRLGRSELNAQSVDLGSIVAAVRDELAAEINGRRVDWRIGPLPTVHGDPTLLRQVFANLLGNALKFTAARPVATIEVHAQVNDAAPPEHTIVVRDNGVGFDPKYTDKLFGVFQRLHSTRDYPGSGIGLATVRRIVVRHGGRVWATGLSGVGATFTFTLPVRPPGDAPGAGRDSP